ncbi:MAG: peptide chain release factor N(5)-glutamine methyltransferase [Succinatimonas hippei]|nr:peptide chain release factor N(5)-glutamine methyltransferase [Succinatimonas hippei]
MTTLNEALRSCQSALKAVAHEESGVEARAIVEYVTAADRAALIVNGSESVDNASLERIRALVSKRLEGTPLAYVLGYRYFYGLKLHVTPEVLIPRSDTETLVEEALQRSFTTVLDLGTGSGAVILAIKASRPQSVCTACDISEGALEVAKFNAKSLGLEVSFILSSWFNAGGLNSSRFDLIVSNPPYIEQGDLHLTQTSLPYEPSIALTSGKDGLDDIRRIVSEAPSHLNPGGALMLEHGYDQGPRVREIMEKSGFKRIRTVRDLGGNERVTSGEWS